MLGQFEYAAFLGTSSANDQRRTTNDGFSPTTNDGFSRYTSNYFLSFPTSSQRTISMLLKNRLFTPGPTPLLPAAQNAMAAFTAHHRTADFRALFTRVLADMKDFIGTSNDAF